MLVLVVGVNKKLILKLTREDNRTAEIFRHFAVAPEVKGLGNVPHYRRRPEEDWWRQRRLGV